MQSTSAATSATSVSDLLEDHFDSLNDLEPSPRNTIAVPAPREVVQNNILYEDDLGTSSISKEELDSAKAEASAWRASQEALVNRVHLLESRILEEAARADAGYSAAERAQHSLTAGFEDFKQQSTLMVEECARREAEIVAHFAAQIQAKEEEHRVEILNLQEQLQNAIEEKNRLLASLEDDHREALELRGRVENASQLQSAVKELTRQKKVLEGSLEKEKATSKDLSERLIAAEATAMQASQQAEAACKQWDIAVHEAQQAQQRETQLTDELKNLQGEGNADADAAHTIAKEQLAVMSELARKRGAALRQIINVLAGFEAGSDNTTDEAESAVQLVISVCQGVVDAETEWEKEKEELQEALVEAMEGAEDLIRRLRKEEDRNKELEKQEADARSVLSAVEKIQNRATMAENTLNACREELENAASKAAAAVMEAAQLKAAAAAAEARAQQAENEVVVLLQGAGAKEQRADEMRAAAVAAMDVSQRIQSTIQQACAAAAAELQHTELELVGSSSSAASHFENSSDNSNNGATIQHHGIINAVYNCIDRLQEAAAVDISSNNDKSSGEALASAVELALLEASSGFSSVAALVQEYLRVQAALLRAVGRGTTTAEAEKSQTNRSTAGAVVGDGKQETSLEALLSDLLDRFSGLTAAVQNEKSNLEEQLSILHAEHAELLNHCESLESVLRSAVHAGPDGSVMDTTGQALLQLVTARRRIAELEAECAALCKSSQQAQQAAEESKASAVRNWAEVRSDVAQLVQHAERAQLDAESALQQQRAETARLVSEARAKEHAAAAARSEAEADVSQFREEAASLSRQLQNALMAATTWETCAKSAEDALEVARTRLQEATQQQQQQQLDRTATDVDVDSTANDGEIKPLTGLQPSVHLSSEDIDKLRRRVIHLESALKELQEHAATSARELIEARAKMEIAEEAAAAHHAASEAAMRQVEIATTRATEAEMKRAALELEYLEQQTLQQQQLPSALPSLPTITTTTANITNITNSKNREENDTMLKTTLNMPPPTADIPGLRRRLEAALRQIVGLKSLNANLEQQLIANVTSLRATTSLTGGNNNASTTTSSGTTTSRNLADATAHAMIDALQLQMEAMGMMTRKTRQQEESLKRKSLDVVVPGVGGDATVHVTSASKDRLGPVERVVALWKQACATRDEKLEEAARRLQVAGIELGAKESELAAMKQAAKALKKARNEAIAAATDMEKRMREALSCKRSLESQIAATVTGLGDRDLLRERVSSLEKQYSTLKEQANASEMRAVQAERAIVAARSTAVATSEQLRRCEEAEGRARDANERASEAERALARHLESHSQQNSSTSLGKSLEAAWSAEQGLIKQIQEMQVEAAGTKSELAAAVKDVEMYAKRAAELQEQLNEAVGALAEQGEALEAVQHALHKEKAVRAG